MMSFPSPRMFVFYFNQLRYRMHSVADNIGRFSQATSSHFMVNQSNTMNIALNKFFHDKFRIDYLNDFNRFFKSASFWILQVMCLLKEPSFGLTTNGNPNSLA